MEQHFWCSIVNLEPEEFIAAIVLKCEPTEGFELKLRQTCALGLEMPLEKIEVMILPMEEADGWQEEVKRVGVGKFFNPAAMEGYSKLKEVPDVIAEFIQSKAL